MKYLITIPVLTAIILNTILLFLVLLGQLVVFRFNKFAKLISYYSLAWTILLFFYLVALAALFIINIYKSHYLYAGIIAFFMASPFIIGHFSSYPKIKAFTWVQIAMLALSLLFLLKTTPLI